MQGINIDSATYEIAYILGKGGKPYSDGEIIKNCIIEVVSCLDLDKIKKYKKLPFSKQAITDWQHKLALNVSKQLYIICQMKDVYHSIALDELTDIHDLAQLLFFYSSHNFGFSVF